MLLYPIYSLVGMLFDLIAPMKNDQFEETEMEWNDTDSDIDTDNEISIENERSGNNDNQNKNDNDNENDNYNDNNNDNENESTRFTFMTSDNDNDNDDTTQSSDGFDSSEEENDDSERLLLLSNKNKNDENDNENDSDNSSEDGNFDVNWRQELECEFEDNMDYFYFKYGDFEKYEYRSRDYLDLIRFFTLLLCVYILNLINLSQIYHFIRAQENFKLYVLFNILQIVEKLCAAFGEDALSGLFNELQAYIDSNTQTNDENENNENENENKKVNNNDNNNNKNESGICKYICTMEFLILVVDLIVFVCYAIGHSLLLYAHLVTLNVAINSSSTTLITLLVSNNFYELKTAVFKRYQVQNMFQVACSDIVERFVICLFVSLILLQNLCYLGHTSKQSADQQHGRNDASVMFEWFYDAFKLFLTMIGMECIVDTLKHGFIIKFNYFPVSIYKTFNIRLSMDFAAARHITQSDIDLMYEESNSNSNSNTNTNSHSHSESHINVCNNDNSDGKKDSNNNDNDNDNNGGSDTTSDIINEILSEQQTGSNVMTSTIETSKEHESQSDISMKYIDTTPRHSINGTKSIDRNANKNTHDNKDGHNDNHNESSKNENENENDHETEEAEFHSMDRRLGFSSLPLVAIFLRVMCQVRQYLKPDFYVEIISIIILVCVVYAFKLWLSLLLIGRAVRKFKLHRNEKEIAKKLTCVQRYDLVVKRIPT